MGGGIKGSHVISGKQKRGFIFSQRLKRCLNIEPASIYKFGVGQVLI